MTAKNFSCPTARADTFPASNGSRRTAKLSPAIISIIVALVIVGLVLYLIDIIPMDGTIKQIIRVIVIIAVVVWLLQSFGFIGSIHNLMHSGPPVH